MYPNEDDLGIGYPNSWYPVLDSSSLECKEVKAVHVFGQDLIAFRGTSGKAYVMDAYCPHLGSVVGDHIRCPFHGWTFDGSGICTEIPGLESIYYLVIAGEKGGR